MNPQSIGNKIAKLRISKNLTQKQLAKKLLLTDKAISKWETGKGLPDITILPKLAASLGVDVNEIVSEN
ncbi:MAG: helix-turn-helix domain-containing protein [Prevotellaceae bacterium]|jgi:transcriptional regulator with XRE-family HTH domain|nr:helix-turn-helix domain-containing protein [Prevotellaceae bacterium]